MIKLSKASKMPCKSFSLPVNDEVCKGRYQASGALKPVCQVCYATKGFYRMPVVKKVREDNFIASQDEYFPHNLTSLIAKEKYFRWFDSGDIYSNTFLKKVWAICKATPTVKHWIPTKARELFDQELWLELEALPNVTVRYSSPSIIGEYQVKHRSTVRNNDQWLSKSTKEVYNCPASKQAGKCNKCRACWNDSIQVVAYLEH
jgi:hypothetical protein